MKFFKDQNDHTVGCYIPSDDWSKNVHFTVMGDSTNELVASVGYFHGVNEKVIEFGLEDYLHAATCIEQAQLYANAPQLFSILTELVKTPNDQPLLFEAKELLARIVDISEPVKRLLGQDSMKVIQAIVHHQQTA